ncbi:MAG: hypothetical protein BGO16_04615 [Nitrobacter sp. 62-23]|nr:MAG: hypothetical protein BGO16_04615 [Nitrobacter sp. 62-23]
MYGTYLRLDVTVHDDWRAVVRAVSRKLNRRALRDPKRRAARKQFYREMLAYHRQAQEMVAHWAALIRPQSVHLSQPGPPARSAGRFAFSGGSNG